MWPLRRKHGHIKRREKEDRSNNLHFLQERSFHLDMPWLVLRQRTALRVGPTSKHDLCFQINTWKGNFSPWLGGLRSNDGQTLFKKIEQSFSLTHRADAVENPHPHDVHSVTPHAALCHCNDEPDSDQHCLAYLVSITLPSFLLFVSCHT